MRRLLLLCVCSISLFSQSPSSKPKLIVALVIDQFRYDYLVRFRADYHYGLARLLEQGAVFTNAHHEFFPTVTAIGHTTFMTGAAPSVTGIIANEWYDRASKAPVTSVSDPSTKTLGGVPGTIGSSPRRLLVDTFPDELRLAGMASKIIGISIKDRSAILPVGHQADAAYWFDSGYSDHFVTSSYYMKQLPEWVTAVNAGHPASKYLGVSWFPFDAKPGGKPFCTMVAGTDVRYCGGIEATAFGNELLEDFAERVLVNEKLGQHDGIDVLMLSLSSNDYVGHAMGPDAAEVRDISIRTDQLLGKLFDLIDDRLGKGNTLVVLTADHGVAPVPEENQKRKMPGGRLDSGLLKDALEKALSNRFGKGPWVVVVPYESTGSYYLNYDTVAKWKADKAEAVRIAAETARAFPHIARVFTRDGLLRGEGGADAVGRAVTLGFYAPRAADLVAVPEPYYIFSASATGTTHGTPYIYDTHVPIIFYGAGIGPGVYHERVAVSDIAATLAALLGVEPPSGSSGRLLPHIVR
jgi:predicted AlkP superfamily pyrophosphatase or phosphodiesterase